MMKSARLCNDMILMFPVKYCREYDYNTTILLSAVSHLKLIKSDPNMNNRDKILMNLRNIILYKICLRMKDVFAVSLSEKRSLKPNPILFREK